MSTLVKCVNGHFYDADKTKDCPYCRNIQEERKRISFGLDGHPVFSVDDGGIGDSVTMAMPAGGGPDSTFLGGGAPAREEGLGNDGDSVTVGLFSRARGTSYITGWLVGVDGIVKGRDYRVFHGQNWVGRSYNSDIIIHEDSGIADVKQCCVVYDSLSNRFFLTPGPGAATYLNDSLLENPRELIMGDVIGMGNSKFEFIPFCREGHVWKIEES